MLKAGFKNITSAVIVVLSLEIMSPAIVSAQDTADDSGFFLWTNNSISLLHGNNFKVDPKKQSTATYEHAHESKIGDFFMFVDFTEFHDTDDNESTWYGELGPRLSFGKLLDKDLSYTFFDKSLFEVKDVLLALQYERGEDPDLAETALVGIGFNLDVRDAGVLGGLNKFNYVQLNFYARNELTPEADDGFNDMQITMIASYPFAIGNSQFLIDGYFDWVLGLGDEDWGYHLNPQVTMDLGAKWDHPNKLFVGVELDMWLHKYQIPSSSLLNTNQYAYSLLMKYNF
jgi:nucleoside-specific outer membrane channel protein Tsx